MPAALVNRIGEHTCRGRRTRESVICLQKPTPRCENTDSGERLHATRTRTTCTTSPYVEGRRVGTTRGAAKGKVLTCGSPCCVKFVNRQSLTLSSSGCASIPSKGR